MITAYVLADIADSRAMLPLAQLLRQPNPLLRRAAIETFGLWGERRQRAQCQKLIEPFRLDRSPIVRESAEYLCRQLTTRGLKRIQISAQKSVNLGA